MIPHLTNSRYPLRENNTVHYWIDGLSFYQRLREVISHCSTRLWGGISFIQPSFEFPDQTPFWIAMQEAASRGVDVRLVVWRNPHFFLSGHIFQGTDAEREMLKQVAPDVQVRWEESPSPAHCHHQKFWVIDDKAFVGGMVLSNSTIEDRAHSLHPSGKHDSFVELAGDAVEDVADNFIQRWNAAATIVSHPPKEKTKLINRRVAPSGEARLQISRTTAPGLYAATGEADIWEQYKLAFAHATRSIYIENQHPGEAMLLSLLAGALRRGVSILYLVPGQPMKAIYEARKNNDPRYASTFSLLSSLESEKNFTLAALSTKGREIYVHSKLCIVDGEWVTIGSANLVDLSMCQDHTEMNVSSWGEESAMRLLRDLYEEHTHTKAIGDDVALVRSMQEIAWENHTKQERQGHLYALRPSLYASYSQEEA